MAEYIYVLTNPSMPGLLKIGRTTTHPTQRRVELQSTGVAKPFQLEFSAIVDDSKSRERDIHIALRKYRVERNREFFELPLRSAIKLMLPVLGEYEVDSAANGLDIPEIQRQLEAKRAMKAESERLRKEAEVEKRKEQYRREVEDVRAQYSIAVRKLQELGPRPIKPTQSVLASFFEYCFIPWPFGWLVWLCAASYFVAKNPRQELVVISIGLLVAGYIAHSLHRKRSADYIARIAPFQGIESGLYDLHQKARRLGVNLTDDSRTVVRCPHCGQSLSVTSGRYLEITCPTCRNSFDMQT